MKLLFAFFLYILADHAQSTRGHFIVNGDKTDITEAPYSVYLTLHNELLSGGTIVDVRHVLSAAHSFDDVTGGATDRSVFISELRVHAGTATFNVGGDVYSVHDFYVHPKYVQATNDYDVALVVLNTEFNARRNQIPIPLATKTNIDELAGVKAMVTGFGRVSDKGKPSGRMLKLYVPVWTIKACRLAYPDLTARLFCAGFKEGKRDVCDGDSGGPLVVNGAVIGIVSSGSVCAQAGSPGKYTNVAIVRRWVEDLINRT